MQTLPQRMMHLPFSTQGLFFISSGFRKGSSGIPSSIHFTNLQRGREGGWAQPQGARAAKRGDLGGKSCSGGGILGGTYPQLCDKAGREQSHP